MTRGILLSDIAKFQHISLIPLGESVDFYSQWSQPEPIQYALINALQILVD